MCSTYLIVCSVVALISGAISGHPKFNSGKIVGGTATTIDHYPYQISLGYFGLHNCGASIIGDQWVLTAGHCIYLRNPEIITLRAGSTTVGRDGGGTLYYVEEFIIHEEYDDDTLNNDIGLVRINSTFEFGPDVQVISLPEQNETVPVGTIAVVTGWGYINMENRTRPDVLMQVEVPIIDDDLCHEELSDYEFFPTMFCAGYQEGGKDACAGDSGGPMVADGKQIGIVSWGDDDTCGAPETPGVYTKVSELRDWIKEKTGI